MNTHSVTISSIDQDRLAALIRDSVGSGGVPRENLCALKSKLDQARVLEPPEMPSDVVTMNSTARLRDLDTDEVETYTLVYPGFTDTTDNRVSVLAAIGTAILGRRAGDVIKWETSFGRLSLKVEEVRFQPERDGNYDA